MRPDNNPPRPRLLIVEDDPALQTILRYFLSHRYDIEQALSVEDALEAASRQHFDLFLLDIRLDEHRSGIDLLGLLREMPAYHATPAVVCSAYVDQVNEQRFIEEGFDACIAKPFKATALREMVNALLDPASTPRIGVA